MDELLRKVKIRTSQKSISLSYELLDEINDVTCGGVSISSFVRMAVIKELKRLKRRDV